MHKFWQPTQNKQSGGVFGVSASGDGRWVTGAYGITQSLPLRSINTFFATLRSAAKGAL